MTKILFASRNPHKLREVQAILPEIEWLSPVDFPKLNSLEPEETGESFEENAALKAQAYGQASGEIALAEDAGLMVAALNGEPGIYSARWIKGADKDRYMELLRRLGDESNRAAKFVAVAAWYNPETHELKTWRGEMPGKIALAPAGENGFGYDPVFIPEGFEQTYAQLGNQIKNEISHRRKALNQFAEWLETSSS